MKHPWLFRTLVFASCATVLCIGCRRKRPVAESPAPAYAPAAIPTAAAAPQEPVPGLPLAARPKVGAPLPPMTTEMMLNFEARFGRPPTNYSELSRLKAEPQKK